MVAHTPYGDGSNVGERDSIRRLQKENATHFLKSLTGIFCSELIRVTLFGGRLTGGMMDITQ